MEEEEEGVEEEDNEKEEEEEGEENNVFLPQFVYGNVDPKDDESDICLIKADEKEISQFPKIVHSIEHH